MTEAQRDKLMLGIRRWRGTAIDLYVGDPALFVSDRCVTMFDIDRLADVLAESEGIRHLSLAMSTKAPWPEALPLMLSLMKAQDHELGRITIVLAGRAQYDVYQQALFATFPDEP